MSGLLLAGRCISDGFYVHASYRVTGSSAAAGEAVSALAALSAREGLLPHDVSWPTVARALAQLRGSV